MILQKKRRKREVEGGGTKRKENLSRFFSLHPKCLSEQRYRNKLITVFLLLSRF